MLANNNLGIMNLGFPDVCLTPMPAPVPTPYPNIAFSVTHIPSQINIFIGIGLAENLATTGTISNGDNAGVALGVASGTIMGPDRGVLGSIKVLIAAIPGTRLTGLNIQNSTNCPGFTVIPAQFITYFFG